MEQARLQQIYLHGTAARVLTSGHPPELEIGVNVWSRAARNPETSYFVESAAHHDIYTVHVVSLENDVGGT